jgi:hypothetical protein
MSKGKDLSRSGSSRAGAELESHFILSKAFCCVFTILKIPVLILLEMRAIWAFILNSLIANKFNTKMIVWEACYLGLQMRMSSTHYNEAPYLNSSSLSSFPKALPQKLELSPKS